MNELSKIVSVRHYRLEALILAAAFLAVNVASALFQKPLSYHDGKGFEGVRYFQIAEEFAQGKPIAAEAPFVYRAGTPFLAAHVSKRDLFFSFKAVNIVANILSLALLIVWLRLYVRDWKIRVLLGLMYLLQWDAPPRFLWFSIIHTDPWLWVFLLAGLIGIYHVQHGGPLARRWLAILCATSFVGVMFREVALMIPVALLFAHKPLACADGVSATLKALRWPSIALFLPLVFGAFGLFFVRLHVTQTDTYSFAWTAAHWIYTKSLPNIVHPWLLAFGPMLFLVIYDWRRASGFLAKNQFLLIYLLGFAVLAYIGGSDSERLTFWTMPAVYVLLGRAVEEHRVLLRSTPLILTLAVCQLIASRAFMLTPDFPNEHPARSVPLFTPGLGHDFSYMDTVSILGGRAVEMASLIEYLVFGLILFEWLNHRRRKLTLLSSETHSSEVRA